MFPKEKLSIVVRVLFTARFMAEKVLIGAISSGRNLRRQHRAKRAAIGPSEVKFEERQNGARDNRRRLHSYVKGQDAHQNRRDKRQREGHEPIDNQ